MASFKPRGNAIEKKKELGRPGTSRSGRATVSELFELFLDDGASKTDSAKWNALRIMK